MIMLNINIYVKDVRKQTQLFTGSKQLKWGKNWEIFDNIQCETRIPSLTNYSSIAK